MTELNGWDTHTHTLQCPWCILTITGVMILPTQTMDYYMGKPVKNTIHLIAYYPICLIPPIMGNDPWPKSRAASASTSFAALVRSMASLYSQRAWEFPATGRWWIIQLAPWKTKTPGKGCIDGVNSWELNFVYPVPNLLNHHTNVWEGTPSTFPFLSSIPSASGSTQEFKYCGIFISLDSPEQLASSAQQATSWACAAGEGWLASCDSWWFYKVLGQVQLSGMTTWITLCEWQCDIGHVHVFDLQTHKTSRTNSAEISFQSLSKTRFLIFTRLVSA